MSNFLSEIEAGDLIREISTGNTFIIISLVEDMSTKDIGEGKPKLMVLYKGRKENDTLYVINKSEFVDNFEKLFPPTSIGNTIVITIPYENAVDLEILSYEDALKIKGNKSYSMKEYFTIRNNLPMHCTSVYDKNSRRNLLKKING